MIFCLDAVTGATTVQLIPRHSKTLHVLVEIDMLWSSRPIINLWKPLKTCHSIEFLCKNFTSSSKITIFFFAQLLALTPVPWEIKQATLVLAVRSYTASLISWTWTQWISSGLTVQTCRYLKHGDELRYAFATMWQGKRKRKHGSAYTRIVLSKEPLYSLSPEVEA